MATINNRVIQKHRIETEANWLAASVANRTIYSGEIIFSTFVDIGGTAYTGVKINDATSSQLFESLAYKYLFTGEFGGIFSANSFITSSASLKFGGTFQAGSFPYTDTNWGFLCKPSVAGAVGAFGVQNSSGTEIFRLAESSAVLLPGAYSFTTASAANVFVDSAGQLFRSTSSKEYKEVLEPLDTSLSEELLDRIELVFYKSLCELDNNDWTYYGAIAEDLAEIDPRYVFWGYKESDYEVIEYKLDDEESFVNKKVLKKGAKMSPVGIQYERLVVPLIARSKIQKEKINSLESRLKIIEDKLK